MSIDTQGKSLVELLDMLEPAPAPPPIPMTPQTWGWVVLVVLLVALLAFGMYVYHRHRQSNKYRRSALVELEHAGNDAVKAAEILRRTALVAYPRSDVAGLCGKDWLSFLKQTSGITQFSDEIAQHLIDAPYKAETSNFEVKPLVRDWIKSHKVGGWHR